MKVLFSFHCCINVDVAFSCCRFLKLSSFWLFYILSGILICSNASWSKRASSACSAAVQWEKACFQLCADQLIKGGVNSFLSLRRRRIFETLELLFLLLSNSSFKTQTIRAAVFLYLCVFYQEARGVVEQAAETAAEVSLQEGGVLWRDGLGVVGHHVAADLCRALLTCSD